MIYLFFVSNGRIPHKSSKLVDRTIQKKVKAVMTNQYIKGGCSEKSLSQESGSHVKILIKTKLNQKWLAPCPLHPLLVLLQELGTWVSVLWFLGGAHPDGPGRERWRKERDLGPPVAPLDVWVSVSGTGTDRSGRNIGFLCLLRLVPSEGPLQLWAAAIAASGQGDLAQQSDYCTLS